MLKVCGDIILLVPMHTLEKLALRSGNSSMHCLSGGSSSFEQIGDELSARSGCCNELVAADCAKIGK